MPCQDSSALQWPAQSNYRLKAEDRLTVLKLQSLPSELVSKVPAVKREAEEDWGRFYE
jgi:hypothetical protein